MEKGKHFDPTLNRIFFGSTEKLSLWLDEIENHSKIIDKIKLLLKNYLELDNVSFLFGSGSSIHLGAVAIRNFPKEIEDYLLEKDSASTHQKFVTELVKTIKILQSDKLQKAKEKILTSSNPELLEFLDEQGWKFEIDSDELIRDSDSKEIATEYEKVLNYLIAKEFTLSQESNHAESSNVGNLIAAIKEGLFKVCDLENRPVSDKVITKKKNSPFRRQQEQGKLLETKSKYIFHEKLIKALLLRPLNLRRANIFTANYDLAFEYAFDKLGVHYIDGFAGFHKRYFKPEVFEYDIFYPGSTTSGKVQRIEKVVRYFKLHGSLSWVNSESRGANNLYGIEEKPLELISLLEKSGDVIIYPSAIKKTYTLDLPYSELFRQFSSTITQSQSVLITIGYSFGDEHFNDIIFQALSNPTFTLIIVDFSGTKNPYIKEIMELNDPRVIILEGDFFGDFLTFADTLMPDFNHNDHNDNIAGTLDQLLNPNTKNQTSE